MIVRAFTLSGGLLSGAKYRFVVVDDPSVVVIVVIGIGVVISKTRGPGVLVVVYVRLATISTKLLELFGASSLLKCTMESAAVILL